MGAESMYAGDDTVAKRVFRYLITPKKERDLYAQDEPREIPGAEVAPKFKWLGPVSPSSGPFRIFEYPDRSFNRYGLESKAGGEWVEVMAYDDGCGDECKLAAGAWRPLSDICSWDIKGLNRLIRDLEGLPERRTILGRLE